LKSGKDGSKREYILENSPSPPTKDMI